MKWFVLVLSAASCAAQPMITDLQPRGAQKGRPFTLTLVGRNLGEGAKLTSTMPASFTPLAPEKTMGMDEGRSASFLVEPSSELVVGVYPIRVETPEGISNIQLFAVGAFPEYVEDESRPGALPNSNDTIETAQPLPNAPITINGKLAGPERDFYRTFAKAGEKRVFEVEARRCGSAIDPVIELLDASGKVLARSEDAVLLGLDARLEYTFQREGNYYVSVHDARYSTQVANFYRLKTGAYGYPQDVFPLGGQRGGTVPVSLGGEAISVDLRNSPSARLAFVNVRDSSALPVPFAIGDDPEITEPVTSAVTLPVTINGRISKPGEVDRYPLQVTPGEWLTFHVQARELGTSKLMAVIAAFDGKGKKLGQAGDEPLADDVYNVNQSRTAGDPELRLQVPPDVTSIAVTIEDLALRGGQHYGYRLNVRRSEQDIRVVLSTPYVNIPAGGSVAVPIAVERHGYEGDVELRVTNAPKGLRVEGGHVISPPPMKEYNRTRSSPGVLVLTAEPGTVLPPLELEVEGVAGQLVRRAEGPGMTVAVTGATQQGSVDRQRPVTAPWLGLDLPTAGTRAQAATLAVTMTGRKRMAEGDELQFRWKWTPRDDMTPVPKTVDADLVGAADMRVIDMKVDGDDRTTGTFLITTTKLTRPARYDLYLSGKLKVDGQDQTVVSRPISVEVKEMESANAASTSPAR